MKRESKKHSLEPIREKFRKMIEAAQSKYDELVNSSHTLMPAVYNAERTKSKNALQVFSIDDKHRYREIQREVRRAEAFLREVSSDDYDMLDKRYQQARTADHRFGGDFKAQFGVSYEASIINDDYAQKAFDLYHMVEANVSREAYGSETLINAIYDMIIDDSNNQSIDEFYLEKKKLALINYLNEKYLAENAKADLELLHQDSEYGALQESKSSKEFYLNMSKKYWWKR